ncbi:DUF4221 family protein [Pleomorphovibrio marinus]|uniref:DUF4221 family protein n=1 Tax=Pleomorphovibrio marinus TaxID=2164132 RepID=UPI001E461874|nr:DUF4221 family protein [Pleomorphovibrio marinus]
MDSSKAMVLKIKHFGIFMVVWCLLISCAANNQDSPEYRAFTLTQDTVVIDSRDEIINLRYGIGNPELSKDGKFLFHYTHGVPKFSKINLERLILEEMIPYETEGPNGMGAYLAGFSTFEDELLLLWTYGASAVFNQRSEKINDLRLDKIASQEILDLRAFPARLLEYPNHPNQLFGYYLDNHNEDYFILKFDLAQQSYKKTTLPVKEKLKDYSMEIIKDGNLAGEFSPKPWPTVANEKILFTNMVFNEVLIYDMHTDSIYSKEWESILTENKNEYKMPAKVELEKSDYHRRKFQEHINFMPLHWDPVSQQYVRLSYKTKFSEELNELGAPIETGAEVYLSVFDKDLNIIWETYLDTYQKTPPKHFFIDQRIWLFENMEDEMAFVRITID